MVIRGAQDTPPPLSEIRVKTHQCFGPISTQGQRGLRAPEPQRLQLRNTSLARHQKYETAFATPHQKRSL